MDKNRTDIYSFRTNMRHSYWLRILLIGFLLFIIALCTLIITQNPNLFPTAVLMGNFIIPVTFVAFFYERRDRFSINLSATAMSFFYGGILGTIAAAILEPVFISSLSLSTSFMVGIIEEFTKIIGVILIARHRKYNSVMDGIIIGAAAGMGFAAFESTGYAFTYFLKSGGNISVAVFVTLLRGITSPVGHGTWTAILSSVLLRESISGKFHINIKVIYAYLLVVALHGLWDGLPLVIKYIIPSPNSVIIGQVSIGAASIVILYRRWREARRESLMRAELRDTMG